MEWRERLRVTRQGRLILNTENLSLLIDNDPMFLALWDLSNKASDALEEYARTTYGVPDFPAALAEGFGLEARRS